MSSRIIDARKRIGMSQKELAAILGIAPNTLSGYEKGKHRADSDTLGHIASITGCTVDFLIGRSDAFDAHYEKENSPISCGNDTGELTVDEVINAFVSAGLIPPNTDLTDTDLNFFIALVDIIDAWFAKRNDRT